MMSVVIIPVSSEPLNLEIAERKPKKNTEKLISQEKKELFR